MKRILLFLLFLPVLCFGQRHFRTGDPIDSLGIDSFNIPAYFKELRIPISPQAKSVYKSGCAIYIDTSTGTLYYWKNSIWNILSGGSGGSTDSTIFTTIYRDDTGKARLSNTKQNTLTLTTTGTSGASTLIGATLNIPQYAGQTYTAGNRMLLNGNAFLIDTASLFRYNFSVIDNFGVPTVAAVNTQINSAGYIPYTDTPNVISTRYDNDTGNARLTATKQNQLSGTGFVKIAGTTISYDNSTYQPTGNYITALTGDVTAAGPGSAPATIANNAVTNVKISNGTIDLTAKVTGVLPLANGGTNATTTTSVNGTPITYGANNSLPIGAGTVTSVGLSSPYGITVGGTNPVTGTGTFTATIDTGTTPTQFRVDTASKNARTAAITGLATKTNNTDTVRFAHKDANTDITSMSGITGAIGTPTSITLAPIASPTYTAGKLLYDSDNECLTFYNNDNMVALQIGQEDWIKVRNVSGSTIANGSAVYINGSSTGLPTIALAQSNVGATSVCAGLVTEAIANNTAGYVTSIGIVRGLNTSGFSVGAVYVSPSVAGGLTQTVPTSPNYRYRVGFVTNVDASNGTIHVTPSTGALGNGTSGQYLSIDGSGNQVWTTAATGIASVTSTNGSIRVTGTTTTNVAVDTTKSTTWTSTSTTFVNDITIDSAQFGTGGQSSFNVRAGMSSLAAVTSGNGNVALGRLALNLITTVSGMTAVGDRAMGTATTAASQSVAIGQLCLTRNSSSGNTGVGWMAGSDASFSSLNNTFIGSQAGLGVTSGGGHLFLGATAGSAVTTGVSNTILGPFSGNASGLDIRTLSNRIVFNAGASVRAYCDNNGDWMFGTITSGSNGKLQLAGNLALNTAGNKLNIATGSNASVGTATLASGTVTVNTTAVTAGSMIVIVYTPAGLSIGVGNISTQLYVSTITAGTSFVIQALTLTGIVNTTDNSSVQWWLIN